MSYSVPFLIILTAHEFGHYYMAKHYKIEVTLPYYIPFYLPAIFSAIPTIGTMGAFIKLKGKPKNATEYFDIGIAGPLAGFVIACIFITYGFMNLPTLEYIFQIHPEYRNLGANYAEQMIKNGNIGFQLGDNLLFWFIKNYCVADKSLIPPAFEMYHYPWLFSGYLAFFFTGLNLVPVGQLDGGHILYGLIGHKAFRVVSPIIFSIFVFYAGLGFITPNSDYFSLLVYFGILYIMFSNCFPQKINCLLLAVSIFTIHYVLGFYYPQAVGYQGWLVFAFILGRVLGIHHPIAENEGGIGTKRKFLGWFALFIFLICFTPQPFIIQD